MRFQRNERLIKRDIEASITRCMHSTVLACGKNVPQEPDYVAQMVLGLPKDIYNSLSVYAPGYQFAVSGVFCHQKPLADFGAIKNPELGDIMLVYIEENKYSVKKCNALLMQAKKIKNATHIIPTTEEHQLELYEKWPTFKLLRAGNYNGRRIDIRPKTLHSGAQYLLLQSPYNDEKKVGCAYPDKELYFEKKLSEQIIDLMKFFTGRTFQFGDDGYGDGWSELIMYLINLSGVSRFNRRNSSLINRNRQVTAGDRTLLRNILQEVNTDMVDDFDGIGSCVIIYAKENNDDREL